MPKYIYYCETCDEYIEQFEISPKDKKDDFLMICITCGNMPRRIYNAPPVIYKGRGFYVTDNKEDSNGGKN
jgi:predicted nucleic acid-binding Zn ribbon protein